MRQRWLSLCDGVNDIFSGEIPTSSNCNADGWSEWSPWTECSDPCLIDTIGSKSRHRIDNDKVESENLACVGFCPETPPGLQRSLTQGACPNNNWQNGKQCPEPTGIRARISGSQIFQTTRNVHFSLEKVG